MLNDKSELDLPDVPEMGNSGHDSNHYHTNSTFHEFNMTKRAVSKKTLSKIAAIDSAPDMNPDFKGPSKASEETDQAAEKAAGEKPKEEKKGAGSGIPDELQGIIKPKDLNKGADEDAKEEGKYAPKEE